MMYISKTTVKDILNSFPNEGFVFYSKSLDNIFRIFIFSDNLIFSESVYGTDVVGDVDKYFENLKLIEICNV